VQFALRQTKSVPMLAALKARLEAELPKIAICLAVAYAMRQWAAMQCRAADGFLAIDNNMAERTLLHVASGRKNWRFAESDAGTKTAATLFRVASSCRWHEVDVFAYLQDPLNRLAHEPNPAT
jgi:transposase